MLLRGLSGGRRVLLVFNRLALREKFAYFFIHSAYSVYYYIDRIVTLLLITNVKVRTGCSGGDWCGTSVKMWWTCVGSSVKI